MPRTVNNEKPSAVTGLVVDPAVAMPVPRSFLLDILPRITSVEELHVSLAAMRLFDDAGGYGQPIAENQIVRDRALRAALRVEGSPRSPDARIARGVDLAIARGTLVRLVSSQTRKRMTFYYLNTPENRASIRLMESGQLPAPRALWPDDEAPAITIDRPNAFRLYEQNIGPLTPLIADQITRAIEDYPEDWIEDALAEAVAYNRRSWRYVSRILDTWKTQGRQEASS